MCEMNFCGGRLSRPDNRIPPQGLARTQASGAGDRTDKERAVSAWRPVLSVAAGGGAAIDY